MQPAFAISMQINTLQNANPLSRTPITFEKPSPTDSLVGSIVKYPSAQVLAAHGFYQAFKHCRLIDDNGTNKERWELVLKFEPDLFILFLQAFAKKYPKIPLYSVKERFTWLLAPKKEDCDAALKDFHPGNDVFENTSNGLRILHQFIIEQNHSAHDTSKPLFETILRSKLAGQVIAAAGMQLLSHNICKHVVVKRKEILEKTKKDCWDDNYIVTENDYKDQELNVNQVQGMNNVCDYLAVSETS